MEGGSASCGSPAQVCFCMVCHTESHNLQPALNMAFDRDVGARCRYKESLQAASSFISEAWPDNAEQALVLNLGPAWMNVDSYSLFRNNVIEIPFKYWESPPGLGLCPLDVLFTVCSSISSWLTLHDGNFVVRTPSLGLLAVGRHSTSLRVLAAEAHSTDDQFADAQVLHTRSCSGVGMHFLHFLTACYLVFSLEHQSIAAALASLPPLKTSVALQLGTQSLKARSVVSPQPL